MFVGELAVIASVILYNVYDVKERFFCILSKLNGLVNNLNTYCYMLLSLSK